jgi:hypothetical protein
MYFESTDLEVLPSPLADAQIRRSGTQRSGSPLVPDDFDSRPSIPQGRLYSLDGNPRELGRVALGCRNHDLASLRRDRWCNQQLVWMGALIEVHNVNTAERNVHRGA